MKSNYIKKQLTNFLNFIAKKCNLKVIYLKEIPAIIENTCKIDNLQYKATMPSHLKINEIIDILLIRFFKQEILKPYLHININKIDNKFNQVYLSIKVVRTEKENNGKESENNIS